MATKTRDDFSETTKQILAQRAGYTCSNPECSAPTAGPAETDPSKGVNLGTACHITSAAPGGARYDATLTPEQRASADNGIWACALCGRKIDANSGADYPVHTLRKWKRDREAEAARVVGKPAELKNFELAGKIEAIGIENVTGARVLRPAKIAPGTHVTAVGIRGVTGVVLGGKDD